MPGSATGSSRQGGRCPDPEAKTGENRQDPGEGECLAAGGQGRPGAVGLTGERTGGAGLHGGGPPARLSGSLQPEESPLPGAAAILSC